MTRAKQPQSLGQFPAEKRKNGGKEKDEQPHGDYHEGAKGGAIKMPYGNRDKTCNKKVDQIHGKTRG